MSGTAFAHPEFWVISYFGIMSILSYLQFGWDKGCAVKGNWRVPESSLLIVALAGGGVGAKLAQKAFRHKTRKEPFRTHLNLILGANVIAFMALMIPQTRALIVG